jgi:NTE family protein
MHPPLKRIKRNAIFIFLPDLKGYATGDFADGDSIIDIGKEAGKLYYPYFKKLADSLNAIYGESDFVKNRLPKNTAISISKYSVDGLNQTTDKFFFGLLEPGG